MLISTVQGHQNEHGYLEAASHHESYEQVYALKPVIVVATIPVHPRRLPMARIFRILRVPPFLTGFTTKMTFGKTPPYIPGAVAGLRG